ncbi:MAG: sulfatase-like hydrolase/transferase [Planctomycetes bacterium]|nr:sulfatase-like hydrolase/transferase [Planctomycetota bacterium]MBL7143087.1 sulfatase-like hydrolase/transferase [Phycisphaerae bacterium]
MNKQTRRDFLKVLGLTAGSLIITGSVSGKRRAARKPNVILIFTDDQGTIDVNCYGSKDLYTSNLDRLAKEGTRFTQFYVGAPVCSPSRAALMTGRYPQGAGVPGNVSSQPGHTGMPTEQITIAEMMKSAGYTTGHVGKWHLGYTPETMPNGQGYDSSFGHMGGCIDNYSHFFYWSGPNRHDLWRNGREVWHDGEFFGDLMVDECKKFINENKEQPFFLYWAINMPHYPLQGKEKWRKKYQHLDTPRRMYAAFISTMDEMVGKIIDHLDESGLRENTLIIYLSDHGHSVEERTFSGGGSSGDFRGHKFTLWEGGLRVPCIVSWPGRIPQNAVRNQTAVSIDWMPTIAQYCGLKPPEHKIDGKSIVSIIDSPDAPSPHKVIHWQTNRGKHWAVREGNWKLVHNGPATDYKGRKLPKAENFLSNIAQDATETNNIAGSNTDIVRRLTNLHENWLSQIQK